jgi:hypothetical protein
MLGIAAAAAAVAAAGLLASCAGLIGPRQFEVPLERLQKNLGQRFPVSHRELTVSPMLMRQSWRGSLALSGRLVVDNVRNAVFLADAQVDRFAIDGMGESQQRQIAGAANVLADKLIRDVPLYSFKPEDLRYAGVQFVPTGIRTTPSALVIMLEPATQTAQR